MQCGWGNIRKHNYICQFFVALECALWAVFYTSKDLTKYNHPPWHKAKLNELIPITEWSHQIFNPFPSFVLLTYLYPQNMPHWVVLEATRPSVHPTSCAAISIFPSQCKLGHGLLVINQPMHASFCCHYYSTHLYLQWRVSKHVLTFLWPVSVCWFLFFQLYCYLPIHTNVDISGPCLIEKTQLSHPFANNNSDQPPWA